MDNVCNMIHEGFTASCDRKRFQNELIHEHEFVPTRSRGPNHLVIGCTTCGKRYCLMCGKLLGQETTTQTR